MEKWYVLYSKPRKEIQVHDQLARKGVCPYLPVLPPSPQTPARAPRPLFPRYLFLRADLERVAADAIKWVPGLVGFVTFGGEIASVDDTVVEYIKRRLVEVRQQELAPFRPGQRVRVRGECPLSELDAVFETTCSDQKRAYILIKLLGRITRCQVEVSSLEAI